MPPPWNPEPPAVPINPLAKGDPVGEWVVPSLTAKVADLGGTGEAFTVRSELFGHRAGFRGTLKIEAEIKAKEVFMTLPEGLRPKNVQLVPIKTSTVGTMKVMEIKANGEVALSTATAGENLQFDSLTFVIS